jgi:hypothetical protein
LKDSNLNKLTNKKRTKMKRIFFSLLLALAVIAVPASAQKDGGPNAVAFDFGGFSTMTLCNAGLIHYFNNADAVRGSVGANVVSDNKLYNLSLGFTHDFLEGHNTIGYWSLNGKWNHMEYAGSPTQNEFGVSVGLGASFYPWPSISFNGEYQVAFMHNDGTSTNSWNVGVPTSNVGVAVWFN